MYLYVGLSYANDTCQIKPVLKEFKADDTSLLSVSTKITRDLVIKTIPPKNIAPFLPFYVFGDDPVTAKTISFVREDKAVEGYTLTELMLKTFGAIEVAKKDVPALAYRHNWISCDNLPVEIKLNKDLYRAFLIKRLTKKDLYDLYIIPSHNNKFVYSVQFSKFSVKEVSDMVSTLRVIGDQ